MWYVWEAESSMPGAWSRGGGGWGVKARREKQPDDDADTTQRLALGDAGSPEKGFGTVPKAGRMRMLDVSTWC